MAMPSWPRWTPRSPTQRMRSPVRGEGGAVNKISADPVEVTAKTTVSMNGSVMRQDSARMVLMS